MSHKGYLGSSSGVKGWQRGSCRSYDLLSGPRAEQSDPRDSGDASSEILVRPKGVHFWG